MSHPSPLYPRAGEAGEEEGKEPLPSLDVFLSRCTSEDNASFQEIMEVAKEKSRARHAWLYQAEEEFEKVWLGAGAEAPSVGEVPGPGHSARVL